MPMVTIGLPVYNGERYLVDALESVLAQTYEDYELVISDNASTDRTQELCEAYAAEDWRIKYHRSEKNRGAVWNYNYVFELSTGKYFNWLAHDDKFAPTYLERCVDRLEREPQAILCYTDSLVIDSDGNELPMEPPAVDLDVDDVAARFAQTLDPINYRYNPQFGLVRGAILAKTRLIGAYLASDRCLVAELALHGKFHRLPEQLFYRRKHGQNIGTTPSDLQFYDPKLNKRVLFPEWRVLLEHLRSIRRTELEPGVKARLVRTVLAWSYRKKPLLIYQAKKGIARHLTQRLSVPIPLRLKRSSVDRSNHRNI